MITPLLTQLTYEGLIDEFIGLKNCKQLSLRCKGVTGIDIFVAHVELPVSLLTLPAAPNPSNPNATPSGSASVTPLINEKTKKHHLSTTTDPLLTELRDLNFSSVGKRLSRVAHRLDEDYKVCISTRCLDTAIDKQKARLQAKTVAQLRDFVGKLGGLQGEHQALRLRKDIFFCFLGKFSSLCKDTGLSEMLSLKTRTELFNKSLEVQQSKHTCS